MNEGKRCNLTPADLDLSHLSLHITQLGLKHIRCDNPDNCLNLIYCFSVSVSWSYKHSTTGATTFYITNQQYAARPPPNILH